MNAILNESIIKAVEMGIAENIGYGDNGYYLFNSTLSSQTNGAPEPIAILVNSKSEVKSIKYYTAKVAGIIRPVFTIIK